MRKDPDPLRLAEVLVSWQHDAERTAYIDFRRLVWGHALAIDSAGKSRSWCYWSPHNRPLLNYRKDEEYEEAFLAHYTRAVKECLRTVGDVATQLSGGRDSGSVTTLAAELLAGQGRELTAFTFVPCLPTDGAGPHRVGNKWDRAEATAGMAGANVRHIAVDAADAGVIQGIQHFLKVHDGPSHAAGNHFWLKAVSEAAVSNGARVLLTGQMGNSSVSWSGNGSALLALLQRRPRDAFQLIKHSEPNLWLTIKRQMLKPVLTPAQRLRKRLRTAGGTPWRRYSALHPGMAAALDLDERMSAAGHDSTFTPSPSRDQRLSFFKPS